MVFFIANLLTYILKAILFPAVNEVPVFWKMGAAFIGIGFAMLANFILNHFWTFRKSKNNDHIFKKMLKFHIVAIMSVVINNAILFALHTWFGVVDVLAKFIGILVAFLWNYFVNVKWTWRE